MRHPPRVKLVSLLHFMDLLCPAEVAETQFLEITNVLSVKRASNSTNVRWVKVRANARNAFRSAASLRERSNRVWQESCTYENNVWRLRCHLNSHRL